MRCWCLGLLLLLVVSVGAETHRTLRLAGRQVAVWAPAGGGRFPVVLFSHGFHGSKTQSARLLDRVAAAGYWVVAPDHADRWGGGEKPQAPFARPELWEESTYRDRREDLAAVYHAFLDHPDYRDRVDPEELALLGHSLGGYTVLGLAGVWPDPRLRPRAVVTWAPYCSPLLRSRRLRQIRVPVMFQGGQRDPGISAELKRVGGAFDLAAEPKILVELAGARHTAWTQRDSQREDLISRYTTAFFDHYLKGQKAQPLLLRPEPGLSLLRRSP